MGATTDIVVWLFLNCLYCFPVTFPRLVEYRSSEIFIQLINRNFDKLDFRSQFWNLDSSTPSGLFIHWDKQWQKFFSLGIHIYHFSGLLLNSYLTNMNHVLWPKDLPLKLHLHPKAFTVPFSHNKVKAAKLQLQALVPLKVLLLLLAVIFLPNPHPELSHLIILAGHLSPFYWQYFSC